MAHSEMLEPRKGRWGAEPMVPVTVMMSEQQRAAMLAAAGLPFGMTRPPSALDGLYDEAMARFDAFCFWYARPARSPSGLREVAKRLEAYGSPEALRIAGNVRIALADWG